MLICAVYMILGALPFGIAFYDLDVLPRDTVETCLGQTFEAQCPDADQVVVMEKALNGRMKLGKCATLNLGFIGCKQDVLMLADTHCSGRRKCAIPIPEMSFEAVTPCMEVKTYLEASYSCLRVLPIRSPSCSHWVNVPKDSASGVISSVTALETSCGTSSSPWTIEAKPGQRINLTLYDFGVKNDYSHEDAYMADDCRVRYAVIEEEDPKRTVSVCGGRNRRSNVYVSFRNRVQIALNPGTQQFPNYFLIHYQIVGCPDPEVSPSMWFQRKDDEITIGCEESSHRWQMKCNGYKWEGRYGNCSGYNSIHDSQYQKSNGISKHGLVAIVAGVMLTVILLLLLLPMTVYLYRRHGRKQRRPRAVPPGEPLSAQEALPIHQEEHHLHHHPDQFRPHGSVAGGRGIVRVGAPKVPEDSEEVYLHPAPYPRTIESQTPHLKAPPKDPRFNTYQPEAPNKQNRGKSIQSRHEYKHIWERPLPIPGES